MLDTLKKGYEDLKGTASELRDNHAYDKLVSMVGEAGAQRAILHKLLDRNLTVEEWENYRKVRSVLHQNPLKVGEEVKKVSDLADGVVNI
ncbi:hypothetical protein ACPFT9_003536 [Vibrio cholerae]|uniref:hypothetical protein n=1 Tax=Vibrio cholerae TaxID=666 RepID=UPI00403D57C9|nr:hypothetical protein [Vibrio cholerae]